MKTISTPTPFIAPTPQLRQNPHSLALILPATSTPTRILLRFPALDKGEQKANTKSVLFGDSPLPGLVHIKDAKIKKSGIGKLAADSKVLESKRRIQYFKIENRSLLNKIRPGLPFTRSLNSYRGCKSACRYCCARYAHLFIELRNSEDFENRIYAKGNTAPILCRELTRFDPAGGIGTGTDRHRPAECGFGSSRAALEVFADPTGLSISITIKSDLVKRDIPLFQAIVRHNERSIDITVTTLDEPPTRNPEFRQATLFEHNITLLLRPEPLGSPDGTPDSPFPIRDRKGVGQGPYPAHIFNGALAC